VGGDADVAGDIAQQALLARRKRLVWGTGGQPELPDGFPLEIKGS